MRSLHCRRHADHVTDREVSPEKLNGSPENKPLSTAIDSARRSMRSPAAS